MAKLVLEFEGHIPAKKNSRQGVVMEDGRVMNLPSKAYTRWEKVELASLIGVPKVPGPVAITYEFWIGGVDAPALFDLDNAIASINDLLQKSEIIDGDDWANLSHPDPKLRGFRRGPQRTVVTIESVEAPWMPILETLRDKEAIRALAKANRTTQKAQRALLWEQLTKIEANV
jgi:hypothetical protein